MSEDRVVEKKLKIKLVKSYIGRPEKQRKVLRGMGLVRLNRTVVLHDTPEIRGMINKVSHLVSVEELGVI
jgi:large subunit ribosomal protein L30